MRINFFAPINRLGYGIHAYNLMRAFDRREHQITLITPFNRVQFEDAYILHWLAGQASINTKLPGIMIFNEDFLSQFSGQPRIGFPVFECERMTPVHAAMVRSCDFVFTPSAWGARVLAENGVNANRVRVVREGFDPEIFIQKPISISEEAGAPFTFAHVGKFETRKGTLQAIECFFQALEEERAHLILHVQNPFITNFSPIGDLLVKLGFMTTNAVLWRRKGLSAEVIVGEFPTHTDIARHIYARADCGLFPTRAEGWGLPILEMLASGIPCIVGSWTGQSEYLKPIEAVTLDFLLTSPMRQPAQDATWFHGDRGLWNVPTDGELINKIRYAYEYAREIRKTARWAVAVQEIRKFTWDAAAAELETALKDVCAL